MNGKREKGGNNMPENRGKFAVNFIVRAVVGCGLIFFINQFLEMNGIAVKVGINPVTILTSGMLGAPGVALLYGILCYRVF